MVRLHCDNDMMKAVVERFGEIVRTEILDEKCFYADVEVSISPTFFAWFFTYRGKTRICSPKDAADKYREHLMQAMQNA